MKIPSSLSFLLFASILSLAGLTNAEPEKGDIAFDGVTTVFLIRHAEKVLDQGSDPDLTARGVGRSQRWAEVLSDVELAAVYSSNTKRTLKTASPIAEQQGLKTQIMPARPDNMWEFIRPHIGQNILLVGHSNTIPVLSNQLLKQERFSELDESNYDSLFIVTISGDNAVAQLLNISL